MKKLVAEMVMVLERRAIEIMVVLVLLLIATSFIFIVSIPNSVFFDIYSASKEDYWFLTVNSSKLILVVYPNIYDPFEASSRPRYNTYIVSMVFYDGNNLFVIKFTPKDLDVDYSRSEPGERYSVISASLAEYTAKVWSDGVELKIYFLPNNSIPDNPFMYRDKFNNIHMYIWYAIEPLSWLGFKELNSSEEFLQQFRNFVLNDPLNKQIEIYVYNYKVVKIFEGRLGKDIVKGTNNEVYIRLVDRKKGLEDFYLVIKNESHTQLNLWLKLVYTAKRPILLWSSTTVHNRTVYLEWFIDFSALTSLSLVINYPHRSSMDILAYSFNSRGLFDVLLTFALPLTIIGIEYINKILRLRSEGPSHPTENLVRDTVYMTVIVVFILISAYMPYLEQYRYGDNLALYIIGSYVISSVVYILYLVAKLVSGNVVRALLSIFAAVFVISLMLWSYAALRVTLHAFEKISVNYVYVPPPTVFDERTFALIVPAPWSSIPWSFSIPTIPIPIFLAILIIVLAPISLNIYLIQVAGRIIKRYMKRKQNINKEFWDKVERIAKEGETESRIKQIAVECAKQELVGSGYKIVYDYVSAPRPFDMVVEKGGTRYLVLVKGKSVDKLDEPILFTKGEIDWAGERPNDYIVCVAIVEDEGCKVDCYPFPKFAEEWKWQIEGC